MTVAAYPKMGAGSDLNTEYGQRICQECVWIRFSLGFECPGDLSRNSVEGRLVCVPWPLVFRRANGIRWFAAGGVSGN